MGQGPADLSVEDGRITMIGSIGEAGEEVDVRGRWLVPAFIDSHVHLAYRPADLSAGGIAAAVDLASPLSFLSENPAPLRLLRSGPMITAVGGYPTQSWGRGGYGKECADTTAVRQAVAELATAGAEVIKMPVTGEPALSAEALKVVVEEAHLRKLKVVSHALGQQEASLAAEVGVDALAHTPVEALDTETLEQWSGRAVISTLGAFGGRSDTLDNLRRLKAAGTTILYGTDFGNTSTTGIDSREIELLEEAGLSGEEILAAGTSLPARYWGLEELGALQPGKAASLLVLSQDPLKDPGSLSAPILVLIDGSPR